MGVIVKLQRGTHRSQRKGDIKMTPNKQYCKEVVMFKYNMQKALESAWEAQEEGNEAPIEKLRKEPIKISFGGQTLELAFGATEFESIIECLEKIIEEI